MNFGLFRLSGSNVPAENQRANQPLIFPLSFDFVVGMFLFILTILLENVTMIGGNYLSLFGTALGINLFADACLLSVFRHGRFVVRVFSSICLIPMLWNTFGLIWELAGRVTRTLT